MLSAAQHSPTWQHRLLETILILVGIAMNSVGRGLARNIPLGVLPRAALACLLDRRRRQGWGGDACLNATFDPSCPPCSNATCVRTNNAARVPDRWRMLPASSRAGPLGLSGLHGNARGRHTCPRHSVIGGDRATPPRLPATVIRLEHGNRSSDGLLPVERRSRRRNQPCGWSTGNGVHRSPFAAGPAGNADLRTAVVALRGCSPPPVARQDPARIVVAGSIPAGGRATSSCERCEVLGDLPSCTRRSAPSSRPSCWLGAPPGDQDRRIWGPGLVHPPVPTAPTMPAPTPPRSRSAPSTAAG